MKPSRFIVGYANWKIDWILKTEANLTADEKNAKIRKIDSAVFNYYCGILTVDETMRAINEA